MLIFKLHSSKNSSRHNQSFIGMSSIYSRLLFTKLFRTLSKEIEMKEETEYKRM